MPEIDWKDVRLTIPGAGSPLRTAAIQDAAHFDPRMLDETPIVIGYSADRVTCFFDATALERAFGPRWPQVDRLLGDVEVHDAHLLITEIADASQLTREAAAVFAAAEAAVLGTFEDGHVPGASAVAAALVAVSVHSKLEALFDTPRAGGPRRR